MESQQSFVQNGASTVVSSTPTHGVRKIVIRLKTPTNTMILNGESSSTRSKEMERSCFSNAEKINGKRYLDMDCMTEFQENIKKARRQIDVASTSNALYNPAVTRCDEFKKPTDAFKKGKVDVEKRKSLVMSFLNSQGTPACPICRMNCVSKKLLYQHMVLHTDKNWKTFIRSLDTHNVDKIDENHSHEPKVVDLSTCLIGWNVKKGKRGCLRSSVADVKVNNYYLGLGRHDLGEGDEDVKEAAKILVLMSRNRQLKSKESMVKQREEEAAKCIMCLDDPVSPPMVESGSQVEESAHTNSGEIKGVRGFDLNELPAFEDVSLTE